MDFTSVLFLPLLGGYLFFSRFNGTRYSASAFAVQKLVFPSAALGILFLIIARLIQELVEFSIKNPAPFLKVVVGGLLPGVALAVFLAACYVWTRVQRRKVDTDSSPRVQQEQSEERSTSLRRSAFVGFAALAAVFAPACFLRHPIEADFPMAAMAFSCVLFVIHISKERLAEMTYWPKSGLILRLSAALLAVVVVSAAIVQYANQVLSISTWWAHFVDPKLAAGASQGVLLPQALALPALSLLVAAFALFLGNLVITPGAGAACHALSNKSNGLKTLLAKSLFEEQTIEVTLKSRKVYIGWVVGQPPSVESAGSHFNFLPMLSGYRDKETLALVIVSRYHQVYEGLISDAQRDGADPPDIERFAKILCTDDVESAGEFDPEIYPRFNSEDSSPKVIASTPEEDEIKLDLSPGD